MRAAVLMSLVTASVAMLAPAASAKEDVHATLLGKVRLGAGAGETIRVTWRLEDDAGHPFGASGIYLRVGRCAGGGRRVDAHDLGDGRFRARVVVPKGGIRRLRVGLEGWRFYPSGRKERADAFFAFDPPLVRRCG